MVIIKDYDVIFDQNTAQYIVFAKHTMICPCCDGTLVKYGTRKRYITDANFNKTTLVIRRLKCKECKKIHHELPDTVVPYKHHCVEIVQTIIETDTINELQIPCETSTYYRVKKWFAAKAIIFLLLLQQRRKRQKLKNDQPINTVADYQSGPNWLQKVVWELANHNLWNQPTMPLNLGGGMF